MGRIFALICLMLLLGTASSRADLQLQPRMQASCWPASPASYTIMRWKPRDTCTTDCFVSRLTCTNGKSFELASKVHPATTEFQMAFSNWMPWSLLLYLLPFLIVISVATIGSGAAVPLLILNVGFATYATAAAWLFYASITGNPRDEWVWLKQLLFLNPYAFGLFLLLFLIVNLLAIWRLLGGLFYRHPPGTVIAPVMWAAYPHHSASTHTGLMPNIYEFVDPRETTSHYHREADRLRAFKEKLNAETAFAQAYMRRERTRNHLNDGF
jgi:hypothetical protein